MDEPVVGMDFKNILEQTISTTMRFAQQATCQKFNDFMRQFLAALEKAYAKVPAIAPKIKLQSQILEQLMLRDEQFVLLQFKKSCSPTTERDYFMQEMLPQVGVFKGFRIHEYWDQTPEKTRITIWKYINHLWGFCAQYDECSNADELTSNALRMLQSEQFEALMQKISHPTNSPSKTNSNERRQTSTEMAEKK